MTRRDQGNSGNESVMIVLRRDSFLGEIREIQWLLRWAQIEAHFNVVHSDANGFMASHNASAWKLRGNSLWCASREFVSFKAGSLLQPPIVVSVAHGAAAFDQWFRYLVAAHAQSH